MKKNIIATMLCISTMPVFASSDFYVGAEGGMSINKQDGCSSSIKSTNSDKRLDIDKTKSTAIYGLSMGYAYVPRVSRDKPAGAADIQISALCSRRDG